MWYRIEVKATDLETTVMTLQRCHFAVVGKYYSIDNHVVYVTLWACIRNNKRSTVTTLQMMLPESRVWPQRDIAQALGKFDINYIKHFGAICR